MIVVYEKGTNKFIGLAPQVFDNGKMRDVKLEELYPGLDPTKHGSFIIKDSMEFLNVPRNTLNFKLDKSGTPVGLEIKQPLRFELSTNAQDKDGDGTPEIMLTENISDRSRTWEGCLIRVQLMDGDKKSNQVVDLKLTTNSGTLDNRFLKTNAKGFAETNLRAGTDTVLITVVATADGIQEGSLSLEVLPVKDFESIHGKVINK
jgi:hypothetical protein